MAKRIYDGFNKEIVLRLAKCANYAYDTNKEIPPCPIGYKFITWLWGRNLSEFGGDDEKYVIIFQNIQFPKDYIFAFKGTASFLDMYEDAWFFEQVKFQNYSNTNINIPIADGANSVYTTTTKNGFGSMQEQLFYFIGNNEIGNLYITGHSLGSALAELFTLDYYIYVQKNNSTQNKIKINHINFACPRLGGQEFLNIYNDFEKNKKFGHTIRIVNYKDHIPCWPKDSILFKPYYHAPEYYLIYFERDGDIPEPRDIKIEHSMINYEITLISLFNNPKINKIHGYDGTTRIFLYCKIPDSSYNECNNLINNL